MYVFVSQSGETADTYAALDLCNKNNMKTCAVVNVIESSIARNSVILFYQFIVVLKLELLQLKAFLGQILVLYILSLKLGSLRNEIEKKFYQEKIKDLKNLPKLIEEYITH